MLIVAGYSALVIVGTILLILPVSSRTGEVTPLLDALFTATSASCVTGLIVYDTYTHWSLFGQLVILFLIQIGGMGFMTIAISALTITKKKIGLQQRFMMQESVSAPHLGGIVRMTKFIFLAVFCLEILGAVSLMFYFCPKLGFWQGLYFSVFHSVSAFCNAGFDLMGSREAFSSLTSASSSVIVNVTIMLLITVGGLGFFVWTDLIDNKFNLKKCNLHTKIVLTTSAVLVLGGALLLFFLEQNSPSTEGMTIPQKILASFFQSVSARTAGFNTIPLDLLSGGGFWVMVCLMFIGGSPGSTAGGLKTTTAAVLLLSIFAEFKNKKSVECFNRRLDPSVLRRACSILSLFILLSGAGVVGICAIDGVSATDGIFEVVSAIGTVGLTLGITPTLSAASHIILIALMFVGRVGGLTLLLAFGNHTIETQSSLPAENISVG